MKQDYGKIDERHSRVVKACSLQSEVSSNDRKPPSAEEEELILKFGKKLHIIRQFCHGS